MTNLSLTPLVVKRLICILLTDTSKTQRNGRHFVNNYALLDHKLRQKTIVSSVANNRTTFTIERQ